MDDPGLTRAVDAATLIDIAGQVASWRRPLLLSHTKPDGDALGALLAMRSFLRAQGVEPLAVQFDPTPRRYGALRRYSPMAVWSRDVGEADLETVDGIVVLDTCTYNQLEPLADWLRTSKVPKVAVDHHVTRDELADWYILDETASATCLILYDWARVVGWALDDEARHSLFVGIATDTGWFRHANTDGRTLTAVGDLVARGVCANDVFQRLYQADSAARLRLLGALLSTMELYADDRLAVLSLRHETLTRLDALMSDTEDVINEPLRIASVLVSVLLAEQGDGLIRVSFRSKVPLDAICRMST